MYHVYAWGILKHNIRTWTMTIIKVCIIYIQIFWAVIIVEEWKRWNNFWILLCLATRIHGCIFADIYTAKYTCYNLVFNVECIKYYLKFWTVDFQKAKRGNSIPVSNDTRKPSGHTTNLLSLLANDHLIIDLRSKKSDSNSMPSFSQWLEWRFKKQKSYTKKCTETHIHLDFFSPELE